MTTEPGRILSEEETLASAAKVDWVYGSSEGGQFMTARHAQELLNHARASVLFTRFARPPRPPPTRMERIRHRLGDYRERLSLAWAALRGENLTREDD